jgi:hypothetical protein
MAALLLGFTISLLAQAPANSAARREGGPPAGVGFAPGDGPPGFDGGPPPFGPGGFGPGGPGGMMQQEVKLVKKFDKDGDKHLNAEERLAARAFLSQERSGRGSGGAGGRRGGPGFGGRGGAQNPPQPGVKLSVADVKSFPNAPLYDPQTLRTFFLEFENADWEKELAEFKNTDVEVPVKLTVDGKTYADVGVHFHGASSFMMVGEGRKRSLVLTLDLVHLDQHVGGYRKLNLLNSHEDPSFLRTVLSLAVARDYLPAPKANLARVVINGESWGIYVNQQHFNKEFVKESFGPSKGARWKVPGSPNGRGGLSYLGEDPAAYKNIYEIKSKDEPKPWKDLIQLCKVLNETPADQLEKSLSPLLDIDGALKFLAWENVLANGDGFYTRASDYSLYEDENGQFHIIPYDANETFSSGGGPGGPGGPRGFGPGMFLAPQFLAQADKNDDGELTREEFDGLAIAWYEKLDPEQSGKLNREQFLAKVGELLPPPPGREGFGPGGGQPPGGGRGGFGPANFIGPALFVAFDANQDGSLTRAELKETFTKWFSDWDTTKRGKLDEASLGAGVSGVLPRPNFGGPGGGPGRGPGGGGIELDPLVGVNDSNKPLLSKLLSVPALRTRYLGYVRNLAEKWLEWSKLGPLAQQYHTLIAADVKADTRKLDSYEAFERSLTSQALASGQAQGGRNDNLKNFADKRRTFLLNHAEIKKAAN